MTKEEFIKHLAKKHRRSQTHYRTALTEILDGLSEKLADGKEIQLLAACRRERRAARPVAMRLSASFTAQAGTTERSEGASKIRPVMVTE